MSSRRGLLAASLITAVLLPWAASEAQRSQSFKIILHSAKSTTPVTAKEASSLFYGRNLALER